jgi:succinoglycan biosynthesis transport protein ExoP
MSPSPVAAAAVAEEESIDLSGLLAALGRCWPWLVGGAGAGLLLAVASNLRSPAIWQAEFQIVLGQADRTSGVGALLGQAGGLAGLVGLGGSGGGGQQDTEIKILQSPSVLQPVYTWSTRGLSDREKPSFRQWQQQVGVEAAKGTSVVTVTYRDSDRDQVLPTTQRISQAYQAYTGRQRRREIDSALAYLRDQIGNLRPRSEASRRLVEAYMAEHQLSPADGTPASGSSGGGSTNLLSQQNDLITGISALTGGSRGSGTSLSQQRNDLQQQRQLQVLQLRRVEEAGDRYLALPSGAGLAPTLSRPGAAGSSPSQPGSVDGLVVLASDKASSLAELETELAERRSRFTANDPSIARLERERRILIGEINRQNARGLQAAIRLTNAQLGALERPSGVIERFQQLFQQANREESALVSLENSLSQLQLEQARQTLPWELISTPTLLPNPVAPRRGRTLGLGLLAGLLAGGVTGIALERRSGRVFSSRHLLDALQVPYLGSVPGTPLPLLAAGPLAGGQGLALIPVGQLNPKHCNAIAAELQQAGCGPTRVSADLLEASQAPRRLLLAAPGAATQRELEQLQQALFLQPGFVAGVLWLDAGASLAR